MKNASSVIRGANFAGSLSKNVNAGSILITVNRGMSAMSAGKRVLRRYQGVILFRGAGRGGWAAFDPLVSMGAQMKWCERSLHTYTDRGRRRWKEQNLSLTEAEATCVPGWAGRRIMLFGMHTGWNTKARWWSMRRRIFLPGDSVWCLRLMRSRKSAALAAYVA